MTTRLRLLGDYIGKRDNLRRGIGTHEGNEKAGRNAPRTIGLIIGRPRPKWDDSLYVWTFWGRNV
jgi:hypothetical protein